MSVTARFYISQVTKTTTDVLGVTLMPVIRPTNDNIEWSKYTPSGKIEINVTADGARDWFEDRLGKDVSIIFGDVE